MRKVEGGAWSILLSSFILITVAVWLVWSAIFASDPTDTEVGDTMLIKDSPISFKVVLLVLDAYRMDYLHRQGILEKYVHSHPSSARFLKMKASFPTMTAERIQVMMTGTELSQPSVLANFMSEKSNLDSIPKKIRNSLLFGDDTWIKLYDFERAITCRSFDVADLDTCDNTVTDNLLRQMQSNHYNFIVGHMLGLDHIGHTYGSVGTKLTDQKLIHLETFVTQLVMQLDNQTVLIVVGDHGMKNDGNHGGVSDEESHTVLFSFTNHAIQFMPAASPQQFHTQTSIASTLSLLLNVTVPAGNLAEPLYSIVPSDYGPYISEVQQKIKLAVGKNLEKRSISYIAGQELQAVKSIQHEVSDSKLLIGITVMSLVFLLLAVYLRLSVLEVLAMSLVPAVNFSWGLLRNISNVYLAMLLLAMLLLSRLQFGIRVLALLSLLCVMVQLEPVRDNDEFTNCLLSVSLISQLFRYESLQSVAKIIIALILFRKVLKSESNMLQKSALAICGVAMVVEQIHRSSRGFVPAFRSFIMVLICAAMFLPKSRKSDTRIYWLLLLSYFGGSTGFIVYYLQVSFQEIATRQFSGRSLSIVVAILAEFAWLVMGNRPVFSSLNIRSSYVFSSQFNIFANGLSMWLNLMAPILLALNECYSTDHLTVPSDKAQPTLIYTASSLPVEPILVFLVAHLLQGVSAGIAVYYNLGKILYTVIYLPLTVFVFSKIAGVCVLAFLLILTASIFRPKILQDNRPYAQLTTSE